MACSQEGSCSAQVPQAPQHALLLLKQRQHAGALAGLGAFYSWMDCNDQSKQFSWQNRHSRKLLH